MTFNEFLELVDETFMNHKASGSNQWRYGQTLMNVLWQTHRDKYESIIGTEYDCFYTDETVPKTLNKLKEEWMTKTKIVYETEDTEYEFVGNQISTHGTGILFRSHGEDNTVVIGEVRFIHNEIYYCSESMIAMEGTFYYWTPVDETVNKDNVFRDLIDDLAFDNPAP